MSESEDTLERGGPSLPEENAGDQQPTSPEPLLRRLRHAVPWRAIGIALLLLLTYVLIGLLAGPNGFRF